MLKCFWELKMSQALYRKWRPQTFHELIGQDHVKKTLQNALKNQRLVHAYLFAGPRGSGKTTTARLLAKAVNCQNLQNGEPCNQCPSCLEIQKGQSLDLIEIDAASNRGIEEIRELREKIRFAPVKSRYKVYVIDECHMLTKEAANALLKTLEEPPAHVIFVLATTETHRLPTTIISRCQRFDFKRLSIGEIQERLLDLAQKEGFSIDEEAQRLIAQSAFGSLRDAESILDLILSRGIKEITQKVVAEILGKTEEKRLREFYQLLLKKDTAGLFALLEEVIQEGGDLYQFCTGLIEIMREELLKNPSAQLAFWIQLIAEAQKEIKTTDLIQLPLELAIVKMTAGSKDKNDPPLQPEPQTKTNPSSRQEKPKNPDHTEKNQPLNLNWSEVIARLRPHNHSLCFLLETSQPLKMEDGQLILGVRFKFHKDRLEEAKNRQIIEDIIKELSGHNVRLVCEVKKDLPLKSIAEKDLLKEVEEVFEI